MVDDRFGERRSLVGELGEGRHYEARRGVIVRWRFEYEANSCTPRASSRSARSLARSPTRSSRCASLAVVKVTPAATRRSRKPSAGYCSPIGFTQPADEHSSETSTRLADSAIRSQKSEGVDA